MYCQSFVRELQNTSLASLFENNRDILTRKAKTLAFFKCAFKLFLKLKYVCMHLDDEHGSKVHVYTRMQLLCRTKDHWLVSPVWSTDRVKWHPMRQMLSERVHTVYSGAISAKQYKTGMTNIVIIMAICVCAYCMCVCRYRMTINEQWRQGERGEGGDKYQEESGNQHRDKDMLVGYKYMSPQQWDSAPVQEGHRSGDTESRKGRKRKRRNDKEREWKQEEQKERDWKTQQWGGVFIWHSGNF